MENRRFVFFGEVLCFSFFGQVLEFSMLGGGYVFRWNRSMFEAVGSAKSEESRLYEHQHPEKRGQEISRSGSSAVQMKVRFVSLIIF